MAEPFALSLPAISKHLKLLEHAKLITRTRKGRAHYLKLCGAPMEEATDWLAAYAKFWAIQLDSFEQCINSQSFLEEQNDNDKD